MLKGVKGPLLLLLFGVVCIALVGSGTILPWFDELLGNGRASATGARAESDADSAAPTTQGSAHADAARANGSAETLRAAQAGDATTRHSRATTDNRMSGNAGRTGHGTGEGESDNAQGQAAGPDADPEDLPDEEPKPVETVEGQQVNPNVSGRLEGVNEKFIRGWVQDKAEPEAELYVEILINESPAYEIRAARREDNKNVGVIWRFEVKEPKELQDSEQHVIRAFVLRKDQHGKTELQWSPRTRSVGNYPRGKLEEATPEKGITGYAWDPDEPNKPVTVIARIDGEKVGEVKADVKNEELKKRRITPGDSSAFKLDWPESLNDGLDHTVQVFAVDLQAGTEHEIEGSPRVVNSRGGTANQPPIGRLDIINKVVIAGWSWDPDAGQGSNDVEIWVDGEMLLTIAANARNDNLRNSRQTPDPYHGFVTTTPGILLDGKTHTVRVYALNYPHGPKVELQGSPRQYRLEENSDPMGGFWHADENMLRGWAADPDLGTEPCEIEIYIDGKLWQRTKADRHENWMIGTGYAPNPQHGFAIKPPDWVKDGENHEVKIYAINHPEGPPRHLGTRTIGVKSIFPGFWTGDKLLDTRIEKGLYVNNVSPWYDAFHKGVKKGDVLLAWDGVEAGNPEVKDKQGEVITAGTMTQDLRVWLNTNKKKNDIVKFKFWRDGETYEADVKMGELSGQ